MRPVLFVACLVLALGPVSGQGVLIPQDPSDKDSAQHFVPADQFVVNGANTACPAGSHFNAANNRFVTTSGGLAIKDPAPDGSGCGWNSGALVKNFGFPAPLKAGGDLRAHAGKFFVPAPMTTATVDNGGPALSDQNVYTTGVDYMVKHYLHIARRTATILSNLPLTGKQRPIFEADRKVVTRTVDRRPPARPIYDPRVPRDPKSPPGDPIIDPSDPNEPVFDPGTPPVLARFLAYRTVYLQTGQKEEEMIAAYYEALALGLTPPELPRRKSITSR